MQKTITTHCQICARDIKANTGLIAHHGYQRPGNGWQTASCMGAKALPYEQSRDLIPTVITSYKGSLEHQKAYEQELLATPPATITTMARYYRESETLTRPANFDKDAALRQGSYNPSDPAQHYAAEYRSLVKNCRSYIADITSEIARLQIRFDEWPGVQA